MTQSEMKTNTVLMDNFGKMKDKKVTEAIGMQTIIYLIYEPFNDGFKKYAVLSAEMAIA